MATEKQIENRGRLIAALRMEMPSNFTWAFDVTLNYADCGTVGCAMGLAREIGICTNLGTLAIAEAIGIARSEADEIFAPNDVFDWEAEAYICDGYGVAWGEVTPAMVANALEGNWPSKLVYEGIEQMNRPGDICARCKKHEVEVIRDCGEDGDFVSSQCGYCNDTIYKTELYRSIAGASRATPMGAQSTTAPTCAKWENTIYIPAIKR